MVTIAKQADELIAELMENLRNVSPEDQNIIFNNGIPVLWDVENEKLRIAHGLLIRIRQQRKFP